MAMGSIAGLRGWPTCSRVGRAGDDESKKHGRLTGAVREGCCGTSEEDADLRIHVVGPRVPWSRAREEGVLGV